MGIEVRWAESSEITGGAPGCWAREWAGARSAAVDDFAVKGARIGVAFTISPKGSCARAQVRDSLGTDVRRR